MKPITRILAVIDPTSDEQPALSRAAMLAKIYDAKIEAYATGYYAYLTDIAADYGAAAEDFSTVTVRELEERLYRFAEPLRDQGLTVDCFAEWQPSRVGSILARAEAISADMIFKDMHYHTAISRALFSNTDWDLVRESPVPLWFARSGRQNAASPRRILASVDLGAEQAANSTDSELMQTGKELARVLAGEFLVFHAFNLMPAIGAAVTWQVKPERLPVETLRSQLNTQRREAFDELCGRHGISPSRRLFVNGAVRNTLPGICTERGISLAIMGAHSGRSGSRARIGSTAQSVMDHVPCDLLVLPAAETASDRGPA